MAEETITSPETLSLLFKEHSQKRKIQEREKLKKYS
jgi:hypothetical protein